MSEDQDKSEQPSQYKLDKAKEKGQVRKSVDLTVMITSIVFIALVAILSQKLSAEFSRFWQHLFQIHDFILSIQSVYQLSIQVFSFAAQTLLPVMLLILVFSVVSQIAQTGFVWSAEPLKADFTRLSPVKGLKKLVSRKVWFDLIKNCVKLSVICCGFYLALPLLLEINAQFLHGGPQQIGRVWMELFLMVCGLLLLFMLPFTLADWAFTHWNFMRQMRMSKKEVKDEYKNREGDPLVKSKQKQLQKELLKRTSSLAQVKDSDVIIVNPTHIAIALKFDKESMPSPKVMSAGKGEFAVLIRQQARKHGVPVIQHRPLARLLYKECLIGGYVPGSCFSMLAPVFRWVLGMDQVATTS
jgi:flagellar biosynthesis protein FlhB